MTPSTADAAAEVAADLDAMLATLKRLRGHAQPDAAAADELDYLAARMRWLARQHGNLALAAGIRDVGRHCAAAARAFRQECPS
jgi:hypothetical protein